MFVEFYEGLLKVVRKCMVHQATKIAWERKNRWGMSFLTCGAHARTNFSSIGENVAGQQFY